MYSEEINGSLNQNSNNATHGEKKIFKCFTCDSKFPKSDGLLDHLKSGCVEDKKYKKSIRKTTNGLDSALSETVSGINNSPKNHNENVPEHYINKENAEISFNIEREPAQMHLESTMTSGFDKDFFNVSESAMTLEFDEKSAPEIYKALESTIKPEVSKSSIKPKFDQTSPDEGFEVSLPIEEISDITMIIDEDDEEVTFNNLRSDMPILVTRKRKRQEFKNTDHLFGLVRFYIFYFQKRLKTL